jgi:hypothetical protein
VSTGDREPRNRSSSISEARATGRCVTTRRSHSISIESGGHRYAVSWGQVLGTDSGSAGPIQGDWSHLGSGVEVLAISRKAPCRGRSRDRAFECEVSMVRRGSTVRVRQRACIKALQIGFSRCLRRRNFDASRVRDGVHFGTGGHARASAPSRDTSSNVLETVHRGYPLGKLLQMDGWRCPPRHDSDFLPR